MMAMNPSHQPGRVITFYSYKGGTGRSMALSNVAWVLAAAGKSVLLIDWDLEAPGLHRYFKPFLIDHELSGSDGLMDVIDNYACEAIKPLESGQKLSADWWLPLADITDRVLSIDFEQFPPGGKIDLLPAGRQSPNYAVKVNAFNWQNFYDRLGGGGFLDGMMAGARSNYDYVLIDSRTGVSDTAGICTAQMPDTLVVCFTYNNQSIKGSGAVAASARARRAELVLLKEQQTQAASEKGVLRDTPRPYRIFPIPMRVDGNESDRLALRQAFARGVFGDMIDGEAAADRARYWSRVEVPHQAFYSYEEVLAPFKDDPHDPKSVLSAFVRIVQYLTGGEVSEFSLPIAPPVRQTLLEAFAETPQTAATRQASAEAARESEEQALLRRADTLILGLEEADRERARSLLCRLVRIGKVDEGGRNYPIRVAVTDIVDDQRSVLSVLAHGALLAISTETRPVSSRSATPEQVVGLADDRLVTQWPTLERWLAEDQDFLLWRQQLRDYRNDWSRTKERAALMSGSLLGEARLWALKRPTDLNLVEHEFIQASMDAAEQPAPASVVQDKRVSYTGVAAPELLAASSSRRQWVGGAVAAALVGVPAWVFLRSRHEVLMAPPPPPPAGVPVPDLVGSSSADAQKIARSLGLSLVMLDATTKAEQAFIDGVVVEQQPQPRTAVSTGWALRITVATKITAVPLVVGQELRSALASLHKSNLKLLMGPPISSADAKVAPGTVVAQSPEPGTQVPQDTVVTVRIAEVVAVATIDALQGFKVAIFFYEDDKRASGLADEIKAHLRKSRFTGPIDKRPSTDQFMTDVYPPRTVEVRYEQGAEDEAASALQFIVERVAGVGKVHKFSVANKTEKYVSVFIPHGS